MSGLSGSAGRWPQYVLMRIEKVGERTEGRRTAYFGLYREDGHVADLANIWDFVERGMVGLQRVVSSTRV